MRTAEVNGRVEYVLAERVDILETPYLCLVEAKKDDFEKGLAQCLVGMKVCQILNREAGRDIEIYGLVTNAYTWRFYKLSPEDQVFESMIYSFQTQMTSLFGILDRIFAACEHNIDALKEKAQ